jgi:parvulin-like peptidyl-prolyl isomerase
MVKRIGILSLLIVLIWSCGGNPGAEDGYASTREGRKVILTVAGAEYTNADFLKYVRVTTGQEFAALAPEAIQEMVHNFIEEKILLQAAEEANVALTANEKRRYVQALLGEDREDPADETAGFEPLLDKYLVEKFTAGLVQEIDVTLEEIEEYYEEHKRDFLRPERVTVSQILLATQEQAVAALEKVKGKPEEIFRETARNMSSGMEASRGGVMGVFTMGQLPVEMDRVIFQLKKGEVSQIVESAYGYHIFRLDEKMEQTLMTLEKAAPEIRKILINRKIERFMEAYLEELKRRLDWSFHSDRLAQPEQEDIP